MSKYDVTDVAVVNASRETVFNAIADVFDGRADWWSPHLTSKIRTGNSSREVGAVFDITVNDTIRLRFTGNTIEAQRPEMLSVRYVSGDLRGRALWTFDELDGKTQIRLQWQADPSSLMLKIVSLFVSVGKRHSVVMQKGFAQLSAYVAPGPTA